uniref:Endonuclease-reverse transcriptase HmRTE-e01 n=1 Tax=Haemonchus contortus TaxID=6289 RepID=A0A7I4XY51_HAECO
MFMQNGLVLDALSALNEKNISECSSYVYIGREVNMMNDLALELSRRKRAAWEAFKNIEGVVKKTKNIRLRAHLFDTVVLPALTYASETWTLRKQDEQQLASFNALWKGRCMEFSYTRKCRRESGVPSLRTGSLGTSSEHQDDQQDGQTSS